MPESLTPSGAIGRRQFLLGTAAMTAALTCGPVPAHAVGADVFVLPDLGYAPAALEPYIDALTMSIHHDKHHAAYVKNLNTALGSASGEYKSWSLEKLVKHYKDLPKGIRTAVRSEAEGYGWAMTATAR